MKQYLFIVCILTLCSCSKVKGKIETRNKNEVYLVNTSETKAYRFTVKATKITNDSIYEYKTELIALQPGDEKLLGIKIEKSEVEYPDKDTMILLTLATEKDVLEYEKIAKKDRKNKSLEDRLFIKDFERSFENPERDTVIDGKHTKYSYIKRTIKDKLHPLPVSYYKYIFEVTGQVEVTIAQ